jgi:hypothetical protein
MEVRLLLGHRLDIYSVTNYINPSLLYYYNIALISIFLAKQFFVTIEATHQKDFATPLETDQ